MVNRVRHHPSQVARNRSTQKAAAQEDRFKIVNCFRTLDDGESTKSLSNESAPSDQSSSSSSVPPNLTVVDIERNPPTPASSSMPPTLMSAVTYEPPTDDAEDGFVYDLYLPDMSSHNPHMDLFVEDLLRFVQGGSFIIQSTLI